MLTITELLELERVGDDAFMAMTPSEVAEGPGRLFGGQVAGQTRRAATLTVDPSRPPHSFHAYFIRSGKVNVPLRLDVVRTRDGRSFTTREVTASQDGKPIFILSASFHSAEEGDDWQLPPPVDVAEPESLSSPDFPWPMLAWTPFEIRPAEPGSRDAFPVHHPLWVRTRQRLPDDPGLHASAIAVISDIGVAPSAVPPDTVGSGRMFSGASLDHAVWFHRPARADDWILFWTKPVSNYGARGLAQGAMHDRDGVRVASITQEALLRNSGVDPRRWPPSEGQHEGRTT
jgi:acyl-CoA thioesterase-2